MDMELIGLEIILQELIGSMRGLSIKPHAKLIKNIAARVSKKIRSPISEDEMFEKQLFVPKSQFGLSEDNLIMLSEDHVFMIWGGPGARVLIEQVREFNPTIIKAEDVSKEGLILVIKRGEVLFTPGVDRPLYHWDAFKAILDTLEEIDEEIELVFSQEKKRGPTSYFKLREDLVIMVGQRVTLKWDDFPISISVPDTIDLDNISDLVRYFSIPLPLYLDLNKMSKAELLSKIENPEDKKSKPILVFQYYIENYKEIPGIKELLIEIISSIEKMGTKRSSGVSGIQATSVSKKPSLTRLESILSELEREGIDRRFFAEFNSTSSSEELKPDELEAHAKTILSHLKDEEYSARREGALETATDALLGKLNSLEWLALAFKDHRFRPMREYAETLQGARSKTPFYHVYYDPLVSLFILMVMVERWEKLASEGVYVIEEKPEELQSFLKQYPMLKEPPVVYKGIDVHVHETPISVAVYTPYNPDFIKYARRMGARWEGGAWWFEPEQIVSIKKNLFDIFGDEGTGGAKIDVQITAMEDIDGKNTESIYFAGRPIMRAFGNTSKVVMSPGTVLIDGKPQTRGSRKNWFIHVPRGTILKIKRLSITAAQREVMNNQLDLKWQVLMLD